MSVTGDDVAAPAARARVTTTLLAGSALVLVVLAVPGVPVATPQPAVPVMLETLYAVVAVVVAALVQGRFRQGRRLQDLLLGLALLTVALANLVLTALPRALAGGGVEQLDRWGPLVVRLVGAVLVALAALTPTGITTSRRAAHAVAAGLLVALGAVSLAGARWGAGLPPVAAADDPSGVLGLHPVAFVLQSASAALFLVAALALARRADRRHDPLLGWLAVGCALAVLTRVLHLLVPADLADAVVVADLLRAGFYTCMVVGAATELRALWRAQARTAVLEDRRRLARDLHDGLLQELAYITAQSRRLASRPGDELAVARIGSAAARAVDESRRALAALSGDGDDAFPALLQRALDEVASRYDVQIVTTVDHDADADARTAEALLRITGEAVRNAVEHGRAGRIDVHLTAAPLRLTVTDDGCGFAADLPDGGRRGAFGLRSMRERAAGIGGELRIGSAPGVGTTVEVNVA